MKLPTAEQMRRLDQAAITQFGIPGVVLMENAGRSVVEAICRRYGDPAGRPVAIFAGPGNNGGDGLVIARHLYQRGGKPQVLLLVDPENYQGDAAVNWAIVRRLPIPVHRIDAPGDLDGVRGLLAESWLAVDALFGTGLAREVTGLFAAAVERLNRLACPVVAVDIPSGLHADTGRPLGPCVQAALTVTFALPKPGLVTHPGCRYTGKLEVADIGIPPAAVEAAAISTELLTAGLVAGWLPLREPAAHKGTFGHLLAVAGAEGKTGAAILCGQGALRAGTGLVSLCVPEKVNPVFESSLIEAMTIPLPAGPRHILSIRDFEQIDKAAAGKQALVIGPGLGTAPETSELVLKLYRHCPLPMVVDADALNVLAVNRPAISKPPAPRLLTPHPGEMGRLTGRPAGDLQNDRLAAAAEFAGTHQVFLVLKGAGTVIAAPDGRAAVNPTGNPGMAVGGTGDVLSGILGGLLAQGLDPWEAACLGVFAHGAAGDRLAERIGAPRGFLAAELARELPAVLAELHRKRCADGTRTA